MNNRRMGLLTALLVSLGLALAAPALAATPPDTLIIGVASDPSILDPGVSSDNIDWRQTYYAYDRLVKYRVIDGVGSTEVEPMLAESWTISDDGITWTFKIRQGVTFTDGRVLDAEAVKFSFDRVLALGMGPSGNLECLDKVEVLDPYTVQFTLRYPFAPFLQILAANGCSVVNPNVMQHEVDGDYARGWLTQNMDGSGPFIMTEWTRGERLVLEARQDYWGGAPALKRVIIRPMREASDRRLALEQGDIDITEIILVDQLPQLEANPDIVVNRFDGQMTEYVYINCTNPVLSDARVRQALAYAVDYQGIIDYILQGDGEQMRGPIPRGMWGHNPEGFQYHRDVDKAKALLAEAGYSSGLNLTLMYSERRAVWEQIALIMQSNFADIGVNLKLELIANPTLRDRFGSADFELCLGAWSPDYADPFMFANFWLDSQYHGLPGNRSWYTNPTVDEMLRKAASSTDHEERVRLYTEVQDLTAPEAPYIYLYQSKTVIPMRTYVQGFVFNPMLESMFNIDTISKNQ